MRFLAVWFLHCGWHVLHYSPVQLWYFPVLPHLAPPLPPPSTTPGRLLCPSVCKPTIPCPGLHFSLVCPASWHAHLVSPTPTPTPAPTPPLPLSKIPPPTQFSLLIRCHFVNVSQLIPAILLTAAFTHTHQYTAARSACRLSQLMHTRCKHLQQCHLLPE